MKIVFFGLAITSSWGNGHATTFRALLKALSERGHDIIFFEHDVKWYASNRDLPNPAFCKVHVFGSWNEQRSLIRSELADADVAVAGSFFPDGQRAIDEVLNSPARRALVWRSSTRVCAASPIARTSASLISLRYAFTSKLEAGNRISLPGAKKVSSPGQSSEMMAAPHAAASNKRTDGE